MKGCWKKIRCKIVMGSSAMYVVRELGPSYFFNSLNIRITRKSHTISMAATKPEYIHRKSIIISNRGQAIFGSKIVG